MSIELGFAASSDDETRLFMPDGQLQSHLVRVYVTPDIATSDLNSVSLRLYTSHVFTSSNPKEKKEYHPLAIDRSHEWEQEIGGVKVHPKGTMLLFDLGDYPIPNYKTAMRVRPELTWSTPKDVGAHAIGEKEVYLANPIGTYIWTFSTIGALLVLLGMMGKRSGGRAIYLLCEPNGKLSLSRVQMALWTIAIGGMVEAFGFIKLQVPDIPETLLALMGASLLTTGVSYIKSDQSVADKKIEPHWYNLVQDTHLESGKFSLTPLSLARAQMLFWTVITLAIFVSKSILDGVLWQVPVELVGLMGMSQLAYLAPKLVPDRSVKTDA